jgi:glycosyltransferase involved in cell wall biosynthesis
MNARDRPALRVLHVVATLRGGGAETLVRTLLPQLARRGIDIAAFSAYDSRLTLGERTQLEYRLFEGGKSGRFDLTFGARLVRAIRAYRPHIVHTHTVTGKYWGRAGAVAAGVPHIVHTEHSSYIGSWEMPFARALAARTDAVISFSARTADLVRAREPVAHSEIIPNGVELSASPTAAVRTAARAHLEVSDDIVLFGMIASLIPLKNHPLAIRAFARLPATLRSKARLAIFGRGPEEPALRDLANRLGVGDRVIFGGFRADIHSVLPALDALLSVSWSEAAPLSMLEAMSAGVPIVGTPHGGSLDMIEHEHSGLIVDGWDEMRLCAALERVIIDSDWRRNAGRAGRERVEREFTIDIVAARHIALYARLAAESSPPSRALR